MMALPSSLAKEPVMPEHATNLCPECGEHVETPEVVDRRGFIRVLGERTAALAAVGGAVACTPRLRAAEDKSAKPAAPAKPAEDLVRELFASLSTDQKKDVVLPWDHGYVAGKSIPTRLGMYNAAIAGKKIGNLYTKPQQEVIERILRAISSDEEGYRRVSRNGTFDGSGSLQGCGALIFGEPVEGKKFAWVFSGHHLTIRCDGNSEEGAAFGGPLYYGHSPNGYSDKNVFNYQTKSVLSVFDVLSEGQREQAVVTGTPGEQAPSIRFRAKGQPKPGIPAAELSAGQRKLVEQVMRDIVSPYRKEDADEVMDILKANGGLDKLHLAFYQDMAMNDDKLWHFWRLEGPGFVWNYRVLPHVHTYVNVSSKV
jgi:hypothetical protein